MKVLFITHEGIDSSIFNSQVLIHAKTMKSLGVEIDILTFNTNKKTKNLSLDNLKKLQLSYPDINIILKNGLNIFYPFATIYNSIVLLFFFINNKKEYKLIHARSDYTTFVCCVTKFIHQKKIIWDCRGDSLNELQDSLANKNNFIKIIGYIYLIPFNKFQIYLNSKITDLAIFVSESLYKLHSLNLRTKNYKIIPCLVSEKLFLFDPKIRFQKRYEKKIKDSDQVFLYSGSLASYQSIELHLKFYSKILNDPRNIIIFATTEIEKAKMIFISKFPNRFHIVNIPFVEMNAYYNLADFAILLRDNKQLNFVASPTKFGEYCLSGLPVIMNNTVNQSVEYSKKIGNYFNWQQKNFEKVDNDTRIKISQKSNSYFSRASLNIEYLDLYNKN